MAINGTRWTRAVTRLGILVSLLAVSLAGCSRPTAVPGQVEGSASTAAGDGASETSAEHSGPEARLHQSFAQATRVEPPADWQPPDTTMTGKSVGKLYTEVMLLWNTIRFISPAGKPLEYRALLDTELGSIEIILKPNQAPNHVRSFIALARVGYYDGLVFERAVHEKAEGQPDLELLEAGCPLGTGDVGFGSIGYWLKPEFNDETHIEGTIGACHEEEADTAACKFYITLSKAPYLDKNFTVFGQVTQGLDVARKILALPLLNDSANREGDRPEKPVLIRKVTIQAKEVERATAN